jgi:EAL and modified HD-GYP domain-containing signal transduction protein
MQDHPLLAHVVLGYSAVIDRQRAVVATRLTVAPGAPDASDRRRALMQLLGEVWPESGGRAVAAPAAGAAPGSAPTGSGPADQPGRRVLLRALLDAPAVPRFMIEVPAFMAGRPSWSAAARHAGRSDSGGTLALKGQPREALPDALERLFHAADRGRRAPAPKGTPLPRLRHAACAQGRRRRRLRAGCRAVAGWPIGEPPHQGRQGGVAPELQVILELINRVDREEPVDRLEAVLKNDPTLAFRLLRYINSPGFGLSVEIGSFRHALMILGYQRLKRWLALLLASASKDANMKPVMFAAVRRGLHHGRAGQGQRRRRDARRALHLRRVLAARPPAQAALCRAAALGAGARAGAPGAAGRGPGPFLPYLELVQAIEQESVIDIRDAADAADGRPGRGQPRAAGRAGHRRPARVTGPE